jgi:phenylacetate-CoA ligase
MQNIQPLDVIHLNDEKIRNFIGEIENSNDSIGFLGYSSALELVARFLEKTNAAPINANVKSIITMSEGLNQYTKATLPRFFSVNPVSRYSNIENGIIAQQEVNGKDEFLINTASYFVEIFDFDADVPAKDGQLGRIIITDLYNYAMPMIRYDSGDVGAIIPGANNYFQSIEGRKLDLIYDTKGNLISSYIVYKNMWQYTEIAQYQFVQYGAKDYVFKINMAESFEKEEKLINEFKTYLGQDANFSVEYVAEIPLLASGKRKKIMNTFHK